MNLVKVALLWAEFKHCTARFKFNVGEGIFADVAGYPQRTEPVLPAGHSIIAEHFS